MYLISVCTVLHIVIFCVCIEIVLRNWYILMSGDVAVISSVG
jgi:hypothetical protein